MGAKEKGYLPVLSLLHRLLVGLQKSSDFLKRVILTRINEWSFPPRSPSLGSKCSVFGAPSRRGVGTVHHRSQDVSFLSLMLCPRLMLLRVFQG